METDEKNKRINNKIDKVLKKFLEPNFKLRNDVYLNLFLTHLFGKDQDKKKLNQEQSEQFAEWLGKVSHQWAKDSVTPPQVIVSFVINLASKLSSDEHIFVKLNAQNVYDNLIKITQTKSFSNDASVTFGLVSLFCSFLEHITGTNWVIATTYWNDIIRLHRDAHTLYIRKKVYEFIARLLEKTFKQNPNFCTDVVSILVTPLQDTLNSLASPEVARPVLIENKDFFDCIISHLQMISEVLEILVKGEHNEILEVFRKLDLLDTTKTLLHLSQIECLSVELTKIQFICLFSDIKKNKQSQVIIDSTTLYDSEGMFEIIYHEMEKDHFKCVLQTCQYAHSLFCTLLGKTPLCIRKGQPIEFQYQMIFLQISPFIIYFFRKRQWSLEEMMANIYRQEYYQKCTKLSALKTVKLFYKWRERMRLKSCFLEEMTFSLQMLLKSKKYFEKDLAVFVFQPLIHSLHDLLLCAANENHVDKGHTYYNFLQTLIEAIIDLVQSFDLTWKDSFEAISVLQLACEFLKFDNWTEKLVITGLRLLNLAISKYMSPDMILLIDSGKDSALAPVGSLLYAKCHNSAWEIRDSALENVYTLALNANSMFPSFTNILLEAELPQLVVEMAFKDAEYYVRATAFKCLQEMVKKQEIWEVVVKKGNFLEDVLAIYDNETEGIVRKEATVLINIIHESQAFPQDMFPRVYDVMTHASIGDLHWEVKISALQFWKTDAKNIFTEHGMIDCAFPPVTFSKQEHKIVNLNDNEVRKRVVKCLHYMAQSGCLHVLKMASLDDCDLAVAARAAEIIKKINDFIIQYKVDCDSIARGKECREPASETCSVSNQDECPSSSNSFKDGSISFDPVKADSILEDLLNSTDMSFLQKIYNPGDQVKNTSCEKKKRCYLDPCEFVKFIQREAEKSPQDKTQWLDKLDEFESLLDDILKEYDIDVNSMDCY